MEKYIQLRDLSVTRGNQLLGDEVYVQFMTLADIHNIPTDTTEAVFKGNAKYFTDTQLPRLAGEDLSILKHVVEVSPPAAELLRYLSKVAEEYTPKYSCDAREVYTSKEVTFATISGNTKVKEDISRAFIKPFLYPNLFKKKSKGMLFYGPPGTGKTLFAKACSAEIPNCLLFAPTIGEIRGKYEGETEKNIKEVFACASQAASQAGPEFISLVFFDEIDSIAGHKTSESMARTVNALLQLMDGTASFDNVSVLGATNYPWQIEPAILRRFTSKILVDLPDAEAVKAIIESVIDKAYGVGNVKGRDLVEEYGHFGEGAIEDAVEKFLAVPQGTKYLQKWREDSKSTAPPGQGFWFGYTPSDITRALEEAISLASYAALDYRTKSILIEEREYFLADPELKDGPTVDQLSDEEAARVVAFNLTYEDVLSALVTSGQTVTNSDYFRYLSYERYGNPGDD